MISPLQQHLPLAVCAEGGEAAEVQSDDEAHTLQVPEQSEGKTKVIRQRYLPFTVLKRVVFAHPYFCFFKDCNSTYRLRYAPKGARRQRSKATMKSAHLKCLSKAKENKSDKEM